MTLPRLSLGAIAACAGVSFGAIVGFSALASRGPAAVPVVVAAADHSFGGAMWGASYFPNVELVTHDGARVRFFDLIKDKVVAINFIYTRCGDACPMETARMVEVKNLLGDRLGSDVFFYSISIDPEHDTPEVLRDYAQRWHTGPGWTFLTGAEADITRLRQKLGVYQADLKTRDHNLSIVIGNQRTGRWMKRSPGENPYILANELGSWLHNWKRASPVDRDFAQAPEVRNISTGEELFRARGAACHTVGDGDRRVGPDLLDVHLRRDRAWLTRWIVEPDRVLAEGDPIATEQFIRYQRIAMPNLRITAADAERIVAYLVDESEGFHRRARQAQ
jgi:protein SCO1/2